MAMTRQELRDKIAGAQDIKKEIVHSAAWDCDIEVRGMSGTARAEVMEAGYNEDGRVDYKAFYPVLLIATCYVPGETNAAGQYTPTNVALFEAGDRDLINSKSAEALEELAQPAMRLSGLSKDDLKRAEKDSVPTPSSASGTT